MAHSAKNRLILLAGLFGLASCGDAARPPGANPHSNQPPAQPGQTDFVTEEASGNNRGAEGTGGTGGAAPTFSTTATPRSVSPR